MKFSSRMIAVIMSAILTNIPYLAWADALQANQQGMISTTQIIEQMSRRETEQKVQEFLSRNEVRSEFVKRGVSPDEVSARIASLTDQELNRLSLQMDQARYGGDVIGILVIVVLVLLVIYLAKRV
ncbi:MAG: PA2779 family protein [Pseudobdellovibrionaceae bacterium]